MSFSVPIEMKESLKINKPSIIKLTMNSICTIIGHQWGYKDYSNWMKENGDKYDFNASRKCSFCNRYEYLYPNNNWQTSDRKSLYDIIGDSQLVKKLNIVQFR